MDNTGRSFTMSVLYHKLWVIRVLQCSFVCGSLCYAHTMWLIWVTGSESLTCRLRPSTGRAKPRPPRSRDRWRRALINICMVWALALWHLSSAAGNLPHDNRTFDGNARAGNAAPKLPSQRPWTESATDKRKNYIHPRENSRRKGIPKTDGDMKQHKQRAGVYCRTTINIERSSIIIIL